MLHKWCHGKKYVEYQNWRHPLVCHYLWNVLVKFHDNPLDLHTLSIHPKWMYSSKNQM